MDVFTEDYPIATATDMLYTSDETPMVSYLNTHQVLERCFRPCKSKTNHTS